MNISPTAQKRKILQGTINFEHINYVKPAIFEVNKQINQPSLGQSSSSFSPSKTSQPQPYFLQHNNLLFHSPTSSKLSLQKSESSPFSLQLSQCKSSKNEVTESIQQERVDFASYVKVKYEENQKKRLGQSLLTNPSLSCLPSNNNTGTQLNDKSIISKKTLSNKNFILGIHTKRSDLIQPKETHESAIPTSTTTLNEGLSQNQAETRFHFTFLQSPKQGGGQKNNLKTLFQPILSNRESECKSSEMYQLSQELEQRHQGEVVCFNKYTSQSLEKTHKNIHGKEKMQILSRQIKNSEISSNQSDWFMSSQNTNRRNTSQPKESNLHEQRKLSNGKSNLSISASLPALQMQGFEKNRLQYYNEINCSDKHMKLKIERVPQENRSDYEYGNAKNSPRVISQSKQNYLKDKQLVSTTFSSKWKLKNDKHNNNPMGIEEPDKNAPGILLQSLSRESLLQFQKSSIQQEITIQKRFEQNKIFESQPKKQISSITPPKEANSAKQSIHTPIYCFTEETTPINYQLNTIKQDPNLLNVEKQSDSKKETSSNSISSSDGGALSSDQEVKSVCTTYAKDTSVDMIDENKQFSQDRISNKNLLGFSPKIGVITNQQQKYISSLVNFQEMTQKQRFSELVLQDNSNSSRIKHFSTHEGKTGYSQLSPIIKSRTRNSIQKNQLQPRRSVFVLNSVPLTPSSFLQSNSKNSTLAYLQCSTDENFQQSYKNTVYDEEDKKILHEVGFQIPNLVKALCGDTYPQLKHDLCQFCTDDIGSLAFSISQLIQSFCSNPVSHFISPFKLCQSLINRVLDVLLLELKSLNITQSSIDVFQKAFEEHNSDILAESLEEKLGGLSQQKRIMNEVIDFCIKNSSNTLFEAKSRNELLDLHLKAIKRILKYNGDDQEGNEYRSEFKTNLNYSAVDVFESKKAFLLVFQKNTLFYDKEFSFRFIEQIERTRYQMASGMSLYRLYFDENLKKSIREFILKLQCLMKNQKKEIFVNALIDYVLSPKVTSSQIQKYGILSVDLLKETKQIFESHLRLEQEFTENLEYKLTFNYKFKKLEWILQDNPIKLVKGGVESLLLLFKELLVKEISKQNSQAEYSEIYQTGNFEFLIQLFFSPYDTFNVKDALFSFQSPVIEEYSTISCWLQIFKQALLQKCTVSQADTISNTVEEMILSRFQLDSPRRRRTN